MAAFVSNSTGTASRSVTVLAGTDRLLVVVALYTSTNTAQSATYGGVTMSVASTGNSFVQVFYLLSPTVGSATLAVTGSSVDTVVAAHYTGIGSFQSGQQASVASAGFSPTGGGVVVFGMEATTSSHTPVAGTTERYDTGGGYYADRIVASAGSVTVGVSSATAPDYAGAIFLDASVNASGTPTAAKPTASGSATVLSAVGVSGTPTAPVVTAAGSVAVLLSAVTVSGSTTAPKPTATGASSVAAVSVAGSLSAPRPTVAGAASITVSVSGSVTVPAPVSAGEVVGQTHQFSGIGVRGPAGSVTTAEPVAFITATQAHSAISEA